MKADGSGGQDAGFVYVVTGANPRQAEFCRASIGSLRGTGYRGPILVLTHSSDLVSSWCGEVGATCREIQVPAPFSAHEAYIKTKMFEWCPFAQAMYVYCETTFPRPLNDIWTTPGDVSLPIKWYATLGEALRFAPGENKGSEAELAHTAGMCDPRDRHYQANVMYWRRGERTRAFFERWHAEWRKFAATELWALARALKNTSAEISALDNRFNPGRLKRGPQVADLTISHNSESWHEAAARGRRCESPEVAFFVLVDFHEALLRPLHDALKSRTSSLITKDLDVLVNCQPRILVMADRPPPTFRSLLPHTLFVGTRHGFASKNYQADHFAAFDFVCLPSRWAQEDCQSHGWLPRMGFWQVGFVGMDAVLNRSLPPPPLPADFAGSGPTLLYAPTFNANLRSLEMLGPDWIARVRKRFPKLNVIIKPHPHISRDASALALVREMANEQERTLLVEASDDVYPYFQHADLLVTDVSSVMFFFLALDRPVIALNNPQRFQDQAFDPGGPEWTWRDLAQEVDHAIDLPHAVERVLAHPEERAARRAVYKERIFGESLDGGAGRRLVDRIRSLLCPTPHQQDWADLAWNSLRSLNQQWIADAGRRQKTPLVSLAGYPALIAAISTSVEIKSELEKLIYNVWAQR